MSPRPRQATGRPGTPVIPAAWETGHAVVAEGALRGVVTLRDPQSFTETWSEIDQMTVQTPAVPYATEVPARVQRLDAQSRQFAAGGQDLVDADHLVQLPWQRPDVEPGHLITVTNTTDPLLSGAVLAVVHVTTGTERFTRDVFCTLTTPA